MPSFDRKTRGLAAGIARAALGCLALCMLFSASASAVAPNWLEPADLSKSGRDASNPSVAMDGAGNTVAIWERQSPVDISHNIQISTRPAGGTFAGPVDLVLKAEEPRLAMTPGGEAVAIWRHLENPPGKYVIQAATRPPGGSFSAPVTLYTVPVAGMIPQGLELAVGAGGDVAVTWNIVDPTAAFEGVNPSFVLASVRPAGGSFTPAEQISTPRVPPPEGATEEEEKAWEKAEAMKTAGGARPAVDPAGNTVVVFSYFDGADFVVDSVVREPGKSFTNPVPISEAGKDAGLAEIGMDAAGNAITGWLQDDGSNLVVQAALRPPGGPFAPLGDVSPTGEDANAPALDVAPGGAATVIWSLAGLTDPLLQSSTRPAGGAFGPPASINGSKDNPQSYEVSVSDEGDAIVVWSGDNSSNEIVRAAVRTAGSASFGSPAAISQSAEGPFRPRPAMDTGGDATVVWERDNGTFLIVQWAGYDADPPQFGQVSIPSSAVVGETVPFSASASDVWPVGKPSFEFGDGARADGNAVSHVYSAPGTYQVTVTVKDALGKTATRSGTLSVKARNHFAIGKLARNRKKGTATLTVTVPEPGTLAASGKGMKKATVRTAKGGAVKVPIKAAGKSLRRLNAKGRLKLKLKLAYSPVGGDTSTQQYKVTLQKKLQ